MYEQWRLGRCELEDAPRTGLKLSFAGHSRYVEVFQSAFPLPTRWYGPYDAWAEGFDSVLYVQNLEVAPLREFVAFARESLLIPTPLDECWCLDGHMAEGGRSATGEFVYQAKTYETKRGNRVAAERLASLMANRFEKHPGMRRADAVISVPTNPPKYPHNLPAVLAKGLSDRFGLPTRDEWLVKKHPTPQLKNLPNREKLEALQGAYSVTESLTDLNLLLVDDLVRSGSTLGHLGQLLKEAGTATVIGVAATKTMRT
jgi:hypothetical protein